MTLVEAAKAVGVALAVLALNLLLTTGMIFIYAKLIAPGRSDAFYQAAAPHIAAWSAPVGGGLLMFAAMSWLGRRRAVRQAYAFAAALWIGYLVFDAGSGAAMGGVRDLVSWQMAVSMFTALSGALAGVALSRAGTPRQDTPT
ncbi:hypothetical protein [Phenylobacterium sp.]|uniref:hypothetical protein n=1 Tax=Phenylobacterium sp. TaxID=1871053 RepID=UPI00286C0D3B|nr:hypothetical protein [Phenylobacterium sp.]